MRCAWIVASGLALGAALAGCFIVTGSTADYNLAPPEAGAQEAAACPPDAACLALGCKSAADCNDTDAGDAGASVCCISISFSQPTTAVFACATSCPPPSIQSCGKDTECGEAGTCFSHNCIINDTAVIFSTCGFVPCH